MSKHIDPCFKIYQWLSILFRIKSTVISKPPRALHALLLACLQLHLCHLHSIPETLASFYFLNAANSVYLRAFSHAIPGYDILISPLLTYLQQFLLIKGIKWILTKQLSKCLCASLDWNLLKAGRVSFYPWLLIQSLAYVRISINIGGMIG